MRGGIVDKMIRDAGSQAKSKDAHRRAKLESRRAAALKRIGDAAGKHDLNLAQNRTDERRLYDCLYNAQRARISQAEAMAEMAECCGDFESDLYWWEIKAKDTMLWKGYVIDSKKAFTYSSGNPRHSVRVTVRRMTNGGYIAECRGGANVSLGRSLGDDATERDAAHAAYHAYLVGFMGVDVAADDFVELLDRVLSS
jgi:hypothetical protein